MARKTAGKIFLWTFVFFWCMPSFAAIFTKSDFAGSWSGFSYFQDAENPEGRGWAYSNVVSDGAGNVVVNTVFSDGEQWEMTGTYTLYPDGKFSLYGGNFIVFRGAMNDSRDVIGFVVTDTFHMTGELPRIANGRGVILKNTGAVEVGDISATGVINISDVILCLRMAIGLPVTVNGVQYKVQYPQWLTDRAKLTVGENANISDVILILRKAIGLD